MSKNTRRMELIPWSATLRGVQNLKHLSLAQIKGGKSLSMRQTPAVDRHGREWILERRTRWVSLPWFRAGDGLHNTRTAVLLKRRVSGMRAWLLWLERTGFQGEPTGNDLIASFLWGGIGEIVRKYQGHARQLTTKERQEVRSSEFKEGALGGGEFVGRGLPFLVSRVKRNEIPILAIFH